MRARDYFPPVTAPGEGLSIWRFTSKLFRFRFRIARHSQQRSIAPQEAEMAGYHDLPERTETDRNGLSWIPKRTFWVPKRTGTDRNGPERTFLDTETDFLGTETDFLGTETDFSGYRNGLFGYKIVIRGA